MLILDNVPTSGQVSKEFHELMLRVIMAKIAVQRPKTPTVLNYDLFRIGRKSADKIVITVANTYPNLWEFRFRMEDPSLGIFVHEYNSETSELKITPAGGFELTLMDRIRALTTFAVRLYSWEVLDKEQQHAYFG